MSRKYTYEQVKYFVEVESNSGCKLLSKEYQNNTTKMKFQCKCGEMFETTFRCFKNRDKRQCNQCVRINSSQKQSFNIGYIKNQFKKQGYIPLFNSYNNATEKLLIKDKNNYRLLLSYDKLKQQRRPLRFSISNPYTIENIHNFLQINNIKYKLLSKIFVSSKNSKLLWKCNKGHIFKCTWDKFAQGTRCPICFGNQKKTTAQFKKEIYELVGEEYTVLGIYTGANNHILMQHNKCNTQYYVTPANILHNDRRCPTCNESKGENKIRDMLNSYNQYFNREFSFDDLKGEHDLLRFDFAIFEDKEKTKLKCLIEYDGEFHYKKHFNSQRFLTQQDYDNRKNDYCKEYSIQLIRIPYWEFDNIEEVLIKELKLDSNINS